MRSQTHLFRRGAQYYWRRRIPVRLRPAFQRAQLVKGLLTTHSETARRRARRLDAAADLLFDEVARMTDTLTPEQIRRLTRDMIKLELDELERQRAADPDLTPERAVMGARLSLRESKGYKDALLSNDFSTVEPLMVEVLDRYKLRVEPDTVQWSQLGRSALRGLAVAYRRDAMRWVGEYEEDDAAEATLQDFPPAWEDAPRNQPPADDTDTRQAGAQAGGSDAAVPALSAFVEPWVAAKAGAEKGKGWTKQTERQNRNTARLLFRIAGDKPPHLYTRADIKKVRDTLEQLPANFGKSPKHATTPIDEIIAHRSPDQRTLARGTLDRHWNTIVGIFRWTKVQDGVPSIDMDRLFGEHAWSAAVPDAEDRLPWDEDALGWLFASPIWTGYRPHPEKREWRHVPGRTVTRDEYWWLPVLGMLHGGRLEEYCQLTGDDVYDFDGIPVMDISKGLKTLGSARIVPIHPLAIRCGFLNLVCAAGSGRLFPLMEAGGDDGKLGWFYSEDFTDYRRRIGVYRLLMDYHSFRTTVTTRMLNAGVSLLLADEITGHDSKARKEVKEFQTVTLNYFAKHEMKQRREAIEAVKYPALDFRHLYDKRPLSSTGKERGEEIRRKLMERRKRA